jgi:hypothetical protein
MQICKKDYKIAEFILASIILKCNHIFLKIIPFRIRHYVLAALKPHADEFRSPAKRAVMAKSRLRDCGPMYATTAPSAAPRRQPSGSPTRPIARASINKRTWPSSNVCCNLTRTPASTPSKTAPPTERPAERSLGVSSIMGTRHGRRR